MNIYNKVKVLVDRENLSITDLEKRCDLGNGAIQKWKTSMPKADSLFKVATALKVSIEYFLSDEPPELPNPNFAEETELLQNYRKLDNRRKHKLHLFIYDELESMANSVDITPHTIPFAASGWADLSEEDEENVQLRLRAFEQKNMEMRERELRIKLQRAKEDAKAPCAIQGQIPQEQQEQGGAALQQKREKER